MPRGHVIDCILAMRKLYSITALTSREWRVVLASALLALISSAALAFGFPDHDQVPTHEVQLRRPFRQMKHAHSYAAIVNRPDFVPDSETFQSGLLLYEDGKLIGPPHAAFNDIAQQGGGRYLYTADRQFTLIFSTSDNSDPNTNGRSYRVVDPNPHDPYEQNLRR